MSERYVVAVSGGVDSVVLLDMLAKTPTYQLLPTNYHLIVAHFDHGIREDSAQDAEFVQDLAKKYGLEFETKREQLGSDASEEFARNRRYEFLRAVAKKHDAKIMTAHHSDDALETVAINAKRGTGWRGLAVLDSDIVRPLLQMSKQDILDYAKQNGLEWHEDSTNQDTKYLRNMLRSTLRNKPQSKDVKSKVLNLRESQVGLKKQIDAEVKRLVGEGPEYPRYFFINTDPVVARECLRYITKARLTRPQLERTLVAVKTAKPGSKFEAGAGVKFAFTSRNFAVELIK